MTDDEVPCGTEATSPEAVTARAEELRAAGEPFVSATVVRREPPVSASVGDRALVTADGDYIGWVGGASCAKDAVIELGAQVLDTGEPQLLALAPDPETVDRPGVEARQMTCHSGGTLEIFLEPVVPVPGLLIVGLSPVARTLDGLAQELSMAVTVVDPDGGDHGGSVIKTTDPTEIAEASAAEYVVVASTGEYDAEGVAAGLALGANYVGLVASETRAATVYDRAADLLDVDAEAVEAAVTSPAGIDLGSRTTEEIAVSILAELVAVRRGDDSAEVEDASIDVATETAETTTDPVCDMQVTVGRAAATVDHDGTTYHFCSPGCADAFRDEPADYLSHS